MTLKKIILLLCAAFFLLIAVLAIRTLSYQPASLPQETVQTVAIEPERIAQRLSEAVQFRTISFDHVKMIPYPQFDAFIDWLARTYPELHQQLQLQKVNDYTLLFKWAGKDPAQQAILLSAHYDVVPVIPGTEKKWAHPPFAGVIDQGYIWGRGTMDDKSAVVALMEAVTLLLQQQYQPEQDIYISLTHDEEIGSRKGAAAVVELLQQQQVKLAWSLDEGSFVLNGLVPGVKPQIASINVAEKGFLTLELLATAKGGHSSMPASETAVTMIAQALVKLQQAPVPGGLDGLTLDFYLTLGRHMPLLQRVLLANTWLFGPLIEAQMSKMPSGNAVLRTTTAATMLSGSVKSNVLPIEATATVNFRLHPRDSVQSIVDYVTTVIDDERIAIKVIQAFEPSKVADSKAAAFELIAKTARQTHGSVLVAPGLTLGATDSRFYEKLSDNAYRFNPMVLDAKDSAGFHGTNERMSVDNMAKAVSFYYLLLKDSALASKPR